jgi:hypothetical protein
MMTMMQECRYRLDAAAPRRGSVTDDADDASEIEE